MHNTLLHDMERCSITWCMIVRCHHRNIYDCIYDDNNDDDDDDNKAGTMFKCNSEWNKRLERKAWPLHAGAGTQF